MKKIRKIVALALATVMMMAMSITAFAAENVSGKNVVISGLVEGTTVDLYTIATLTDDNVLTIEDWADGVIPTNKVTEMTPDEVAALNTAFNDATGLEKVTKVADQTGVVTFDNLPAGAYYINAYSTDYAYKTMVAVTYKLDDAQTGKYEAKAEDTTIVAKKDTNTVGKKGDHLVKAGDSVEFEVKTKVPSNVKSFTVYDATTNLSALSDATITVKVSDKTITDKKFVAVKDNLYSLDLTSLVYDGEKFINTYAGKDVVITYTLTVLGDQGYENTAYDSTPGSKSTPATEKGYSADITLVKTDASEEETLPGAHFTLSRVETNEDGEESLTVLKFVLVDGKYKLEESSDANATSDLVTDSTGKILVTGLNEGTYRFEETKAPTNYTITTNIKDVVIEDLSSATDITGKDDTRLHYTRNVKDSDLIRLPFTGGMGTTIFTVLGVAIMAMASALYFATKKKATK